MNSLSQTTLSFTGQAAVLILLHQDEAGEDCVLLTRRASELRMHAGEVAFPGGMWEPSDASLHATACRECSEEIGFDPLLLPVLAELPPHLTRRGITVSPYLVRTPVRPPLSLCRDEIESVRWVPMRLFKEDRRSKTHIFGSPAELWAPVYCFEDYEVWGFTARVLVTLVNTHYGANVTRAHEEAPEERFGSERVR